MIRRYRKGCFFTHLLFILCLMNPLTVWGAEGDTAVLSIETQDCIACHESDTPGIVDDWKTSRHSHTSPGSAIGKVELERRVSSKEIPLELISKAVGCYECHSLNPEDHKDNFEHNGFRINVIVTPKDCSTCHSVEAEQFSRSKKANAVDILRKNPLYSRLVDSITGVHEFEGKEIVTHGGSPVTKGETCFDCHGTEVQVRGMKTVETRYDEIEVPDLVNWPNQGVGRINPDGSRGSCAACHPRHSFSIEIARKPYTCSQCHLAPDVPAWEVYNESKHGNIFRSKQAEWNWNSVPWEAGKDFRAPTCAACHNSLLINGYGEVVVERTHDFGSRLWRRLFGLIYTHPQPKEGKTYLIKNRDGLSLPTTFDGEMASEFLIENSEQDKRRKQMTDICRYCHTTDWANGHFKQLDGISAETDRMVRTATEMMQKAWDKGLADPANPFDESLEKKWVAQWLFYANSVRYGAAMGGPDYAAFKNGWWDLTRNLREMTETLDIPISKAKD